MILIKLQEEKDEPPTPNTNTQPMVKKTRDHGHVDPKAKKRTPLRRMTSQANTRQRRGINPKAVAKAEKRVGGLKAERRLTSVKVMTEETAQGAKIEMTKRKKRSLKMITVKREIRARSPIKSIMMTAKEEMTRKSGQSHKARKMLKMVADPVAETGTGVDLQSRERRKTGEIRAGRGSETVAGVGKGGTTAKGKIKGEGRPGIRTIEQEVQTETRLETHTEAGDPEARATRETTAKIGRLIERTETEKLQTKGGGATAAARAVIGTGKGRVIKAPIPNRAELIVIPKTDEALPNRDQIVQKAKTETTARRINPAQARALTATDILKIVEF